MKRDISEKEAFKKMVLESNIKELLTNTREFLDKLDDLEEI